MPAKPSQLRMTPQAVRHGDRGALVVIDESAQDAVWMVIDYVCSGVAGRTYEGEQRQAETFVAAYPEMCRPQSLILYAFMPGGLGDRCAGWAPRSWGTPDWGPTIYSTPGWVFEAEVQQAILEHCGLA